MNGLHIQATLRLAEGSVYFVRFGSGLAGRLGVSCWGTGVASSAIVVWMLFLCYGFKWERRSGLCETRCPRLRHANLSSGKLELKLNSMAGLGVITGHNIHVTWRCMNTLHYAQAVPRKVQ